MVGLRISTSHIPRHPLKLRDRPPRRDTATVTAMSRRAAVSQTNTCSAVHNLRKSTTDVHHRLRTNTTVGAGSNSREDLVLMGKAHRKAHTVNHLQDHHMDIHHQEGRRPHQAIGVAHPNRHLAGSPVDIQVKAMGRAVDKLLMDSSHMGIKRTARSLMDKAHMGRGHLDSPGMAVIRLATN